MLKINPRYVAQVRAAAGPEDLHGMVQSAIELEHATIPTYLCAYFTLKRGTNQPIAEIIRSVLIEEMLHMSIASNLLIALGGHPSIDNPAFVPKYPGPLPMGIGDGLIVPLARCSIELVRDVFMKIEEPVDPLPLKAFAAETPSYSTIGEFYAAIADKLREFGPSAFSRPSGPQMLNNNWFPADELFRIHDVDSACSAIDIIVRQGEGTKISPVDLEGGIAHYYRFEQIVKGRRLVAAPKAEHGYAFAGAPLTLDLRNVWNMQENPDPDKLPPGSRARQVSLQFAAAYTSLLRALHEAFNGKPDAINQAMGLMYELRLLSQQVLETPLPDSPGQSTGLSFRYQPSI
ncbi:ferritin-like protein [Pyxidicoccus parkwayensis]|uniref:Ferritin-like protein n=1 Tax=Pyxidicoccus parkwayensis TaxID=2813578 RepID=A0ABX7NWE9_9BACT|nr:ferritin-like protein [Pyxidicoccus parkwaysis]QSQ23189.1 ferritin-like protein [Pyxidicoccus parkwaysis]